MKVFYFYGILIKFSKRKSIYRINLSGAIRDLCEISPVRQRFLHNMLIK
jgi:hypothetical protein